MKSVLQYSTYNTTKAIVQFSRSFKITLIRITIMPNHNSSLVLSSHYIKILNVSITISNVNICSFNLKYMTFIDFFGTTAVISDIIEIGTKNTHHQEALEYRQGKHFDLISNILFFWPTFIKGNCCSKSLLRKKPLVPSADNLNIRNKRQHLPIPNWKVTGPLHLAMFVGVSKFALLNTVYL